MVKKTAQGGLFLALALVASYVEMLIPIQIGIPGVKIGLANGVIMVLLYMAGAKEAYAILLPEFFCLDFCLGI